MATTRYTVQQVCEELGFAIVTHIYDGCVRKLVFGKRHDLEVLRQIIKTETGLWPYESLYDFERHEYVLNVNSFMC